MKTAARMITCATCDELAGAGDRRGEREETPGCDVVDRGSRHRERADRSFQHAPLDQDAGEHREGGDRHRNAHEEGEREVANVRRQQLVDGDCDQEAERHRERNARVRDERRLSDPLTENARIELHADEEEVEGQPDLGRPREQRDDVRREEVGLGFRPDGSEQRRPEQDPGEHLAHHARLAQPRDERADEASGEEHRGDGEHQPAERLFAGPLDGLLGGGPGLGERLGELGRHLARNRPCRRRRRSLPSR